MVISSLALAAKIAVTPMKVPPSSLPTTQELLASKPKPSPSPVPVPIDRGGNDRRSFTSLIAPLISPGQVIPPITNRKLNNL